MHDLTKEEVSYNIINWYAIINDYFIHIQRKNKDNNKTHFINHKRFCMVMIVFVVVEQYGKHMLLLLCCSTLLFSVRYRLHEVQLMTKNLTLHGRCLLITNVERILWFQIKTNTFMLLLGNLKLLEGYFMGPEHCLPLQTFLETNLLYKSNVYLVITHWKNGILLIKFFYECPKPWMNVNMKFLINIYMLLTWSFQRFNI